MAVDVGERGEAAGIGGTGGMRSGAVSTDLLVTPGIYAIWMTLEALVSTVEAIDRTECIEARPDPRTSFGIEASYPVFSVVLDSRQAVSNCCLLFLMQNLQTKNVIKQTTTIPPMTPPAMGPAGDGPGFAEGVAAAPIAVHFVTAHESEFPGMNEQTSFEEQEGHGGGWDGQTGYVPRPKSLCFVAWAPKSILLVSLTE